MKKEDFLDEINKTPPLSDEGEMITDAEIQEILDPLRFKGYPTQFSEMDEAIGGLKQGSFMVIGAEAGRGKTIFALNLLHKQGLDGIKCVYLDFENGTSLTKDRLFMIHYQLDALTSKSFSDSEYKEKYSQIKNIAVYEQTKILDMLSEKLPTLKEATYEFIRQKALGGVKIFVLDPFSEFCEDDSNTQLHEEGIFAANLARLARELNLCIIALHHFRKGGSSRYARSADEIVEDSYIIPTMESFIGSSKVVNRATEVIGLMRFPHKDDTVHVSILKARTGKLARFKLKIDTKTLTFSEDKKWDISRILGGVATEIKS